MNDIELSARERALILICLNGYLAMIQGNKESIDVLISDARAFHQKHCRNTRSLKDLILKFVSLQCDPVFSKLFKEDEHNKTGL
jgi:hypothetical protein